MTGSSPEVAMWEIDVEREEGFTLGSESVKTWQGWRVKYRPVGSRGRWTKFLTDDDLTKYGVAELQAFCTAHEGLGRG